MSKKPVLSFEHDGKTYNLSPGDFTGQDDLAVYKALDGLSLTRIFTDGMFELFTLAALVWRIRVREGESDLTYEQVNGEMTYDTLMTVSGEARDEGDAPKA